MLKVEPGELDIDNLGWVWQPLPPEFGDDRNAFIDEVVNDLKTICDRKLAEFCDVFVEPGAFTRDEARRIDVSEPRRACAARTSQTIIAAWTITSSGPWPCSWLR